MDCSPSDSSVHGISQVSILEWVYFLLQGILPDPGIKATSLACVASPALAGGFFTTEPPGECLLFTNTFSHLMSWRSCAFEIPWLCSYVNVAVGSQRGDLSFVLSSLQEIPVIGWKKGKPNGDVFEGYGAGGIGNFASLVRWKCLHINILYVCTYMCVCVYMHTHKTLNFRF